MLIQRQIGELDLCLSIIEEKEGLLTNAVISQMSAHKTIRSPYMWSQSISSTFRLLLELDKNTDATNFLDKLSSTMSDCLKSKDFTDNHLRIGWCLSTVNLC